MNLPRWEFRKMGKGEINIDPIEGEFFSTEALGSLSDALIREAIQNSLDAVAPNEQVKVVITFSSSNLNLPHSKSGIYLKGLKPHLEAKESGLIEKVNLYDAMDFLLIEDFGTRGLEGDFREDEEGGTDKKKNDFFYFWRNIGRAVEGTTARGRWGLGKTVFQAASRINSFFGLTIRREDLRTLLMGQSVLKIHRCDGVKFAPYGYFGIFENGFALPIEEKQFVEQFSNDFALRRKKEPGLSIIIPFPEKEISPPEIIRAVINQYFYPILSGDLTVTVVVNQHEHILDDRNIFKYITGSDLADKDTVIRRLNFAKWSIDLPNEKHIRLKEPEVNQAPKWEENLFEQKDLEILRKKLDEGERIALTVPLWVKKENENIQHSFFKIYLERDNFLERGEDFFIRDGVTITGISSLRQKNIRVIVNVSDRPLSKMLGDSENPAHTEWQERSQKFKGRYFRGPSCLRFVKNSPRELVKILSMPAEGRDIKLLKDIFYIDLSKGIESTALVKNPTEKPGNDSLEISQPEMILADRYLQLTRTRQGFRLTARPDANAMPKEIDIEVAYDVRLGNPFNRYSPLDFELNKPPMRVTGKGLKISYTKPNVIHIVIEEKDFQLMVTGFDPNRDLKIRMITTLAYD